MNVQDVLQLIESLGDELRRKCLRLVGINDFEDIYQKAFAAAVRDCGRCKAGAGTDEARNWVRKVFRNRALDHLKKAARDRRRGLAYQALLEDVAGAAQELDSPIEIVESYVSFMQELEAVAGKHAKKIGLAFMDLIMADGVAKAVAAKRGIAEGTFSAHHKGPMEEVVRAILADGRLTPRDFAQATRYMTAARCPSNWRDLAAYVCTLLSRNEAEEIQTLSARERGFTHFDLAYERVCKEIQAEKVADVLRRRTDRVARIRQEDLNTFRTILELDRQLKDTSSPHAGATSPFSDVRRSRQFPYCPGPVALTLQGLEASDSREPEIGALHCFTFRQATDHDLKPECWPSDPHEVQQWRSAMEDFVCRSANDSRTFSGKLPEDFDFPYPGAGRYKYVYEHTAPAIRSVFEVVIPTERYVKGYPGGVRPQRPPATIEARLLFTAVGEKGGDLYNLERDLEMLPPEALTTPWPIEQIVEAMKEIQATRLAKRDHIPPATTESECGAAGKRPADEGQ